MNTDIQHLNNKVWTALQTCGIFDLNKKVT